jgi:hypothetical protein
VTQLSGPAAFYTVASILVTGVSDELVGSLGGAVERAGVVPADIVWDDCSCGLLAVTVNRFFLSDNFPSDTVTTGEIRIGPCDLPWVVGEIHLDVVRCAPLPSGEELAPSVEALDASAQVLISDASLALKRATEELCALKEDESIIDYVTGEQTAVGPLGDCVGTDLRLLVALER